MAKIEAIEYPNPESGQPIIREVRIEIGMAVATVRRNSGGWAIYLPAQAPIENGGDLIQVALTEGIREYERRWPVGS